MRQALKAKFAAMQLPPDAKLPEPFQSLVDMGKAEGRVEGKVEGKAELVLRLAEFRGIPLTAEQRARILGCRDEAQFDEWAQRIILARVADDLFE